MNFDPWNATLVEAREITEDILQTPHSHNDKMKAVGPHGPIAQWIAVNEIETTLKNEIMNGNGAAVLTAMYMCVAHGLVAPRWLADEFAQRFEIILFGGANSWDADVAFGKPYIKGARPREQAKRRVRGFGILTAVINTLIEDPTTVVDRSLFERIGKDFACSGSQCEKLYYQAIKTIKLNPLEILGRT